MRLNEVKLLLDKENIGYSLSVIENKASYYHAKGFFRVKDTDPFLLLTIKNSNHNKNIEILFRNDEENPEFCDLEFGGHWYELFDCSESQLPYELLKEINAIISNNVYIIFARDAKSQAWVFDMSFYDLPEEQNDMRDFHRILQKIKKPKLWQKLSWGKRRVYEVFNWEHCECFIK